MVAKVFLSLSYVEADFVRDVRSRLPVGLSYFYEESFENGEALLSAMERTIADASVFVLFASKTSTTSPWVKFEIDVARLEKIQRPELRLLIFPRSPDVSHHDLPKWLQQYWVARAGWSASDIARYITAVLLEPDRGISTGAIRVVGRGKTLDRLEQLTADHLARTKKSPNVYVLAGVTGVGRRTFAAYYIRRALAADANLPYGPTFVLSPQADLSDIYRAVRAELAIDISSEQIASELATFQKAEIADQVTEIATQFGHFSKLNQAITLVSTSGFFEDRGSPKEWVAPLLSSIKGSARLFLVSNRFFQDDWLLKQSNAVQLRIEELSERDVRALMQFTAERLQVPDFSVSDEIVKAIGGHPDVANAAVRLAALKGMHILERDPRQLFNIQQTILGENITGDALSKTDEAILNVLSWVPSLGGDLLEECIRANGSISSEDFVASIENLVLGCLITASGHAYSISSSIRYLFRRFHIAPPALLQTFASVLSREWSRSQQIGRFRVDLFDAFVFMHALEGKSLPAELQSLLSPGLLFDVIRETYARGRDSETKEDLERVASWGAIAEKMRMSEATREEILSTVVRAKIRLGQASKAEETISKMARRGYRSVLFLRGHLLRREERYGEAIKLLEDATKERKYQRSAIHELALAYKKNGDAEKLRRLLSEHGQLVRDSAMFADFQIGIDLARGDLSAVDTGISNLARMPDDDGKSEVRRAQLLMRRTQFGAAKELLTRLLARETKARFHIRSLRSIAASKDHDFELARRDIDFVKGIPGRQQAVRELEVILLTEQGNLLEAEKLLDQIPKRTAEIQTLYARIYELRAERPETPFPDRQKLKDRALEIRAQHRLILEFGELDE